MPRRARKRSRNGVYHLMLRGNNKQIIFEEDIDKARFLTTIVKVKKQCPFKLYAYCLMDNHVHLLVREIDASVSEVIKRICSSYVYWYNMKYDRCGHLFQDRFKSEVVESRRYFLKVIRYIHQNPLKAGLANNVFDSHWTSINDYLKKPEVVDTKFVLSLFSEKGEEALTLFNRYMGEANDDDCMDEVTRVRLTDAEVIEFLRELGISSNGVLQQMSRKEREIILAKLRELKGISIRQISRVTGISRSVIQRKGT